MEVSYTALKSLMSCPYSYYLRYIKRVPILENSASIYGTAIHHTIKIGYDNKLTKGEWGKVFKQEWIGLTASKTIVYYDEGDYMRKFASGQEMVENYYEKFVLKEKAPPKQLETFFGRSNPVTLGGHVVIGVFDQIDANDKIIDYKSGAKPTQAELDMDLQFTLYSYAFRQLFGREESGLALRHLPTMKDLVTTRTEKDFEFVANELEKVDRIIKRGDFLRNISRDCSSCFFLEPCLGKQRKVGRWR